MPDFLPVSLQDVLHGRQPELRKYEIIYSISFSGMVLPCLNIR